MNIDEMEAGREMDALVAQYIKEWEIEQAHCFRDPECGGLCIDLEQGSWRNSTTTLVCIQSMSHTVHVT